MVNRDVKMTRYFPWLLLMVAVATSANDCRVRWTNGYMEADCSNLGLSHIPDDLGDRLIKSLKMDGNPLVTLEANAFVNAGLVDIQVKLKEISASILNPLILLPFGRLFHETQCNEN